MRLALNRRVINFETFVAKKHVLLSDLRGFHDPHTARRRSHATEEIWNRKRRPDESRLNVWFAFAQTSPRVKKSTTADIGFELLQIRVYGPPPGQKERQRESEIFF